MFWLVRDEFYYIKRHHCVVDLWAFPVVAVALLHPAFRIRISHRHAAQQTLYYEAINCVSVTQLVSWSVRWCMVYVQYTELTDGLADWRTGCTNELWMNRVYAERLLQFLIYRFALIWSQIQNEKLKMIKH